MDMQGAKIVITLLTGQVVEYELLRVGTAEKIRRRTAGLLSKLDADKAALKKLAEEIIGTVDELHEGQ